MAKLILETGQYLLNIKLSLTNFAYNSIFLSKKYSRLFLFIFWLLTNPWLKAILVNVFGRTLAFAEKSQWILFLYWFFVAVSTIRSILISWCASYVLVKLFANFVILLNLSKNLLWKYFFWLQVILFGELGFVHLNFTLSYFYCGSLLYFNSVLLFTVLVLSFTCYNTDILVAFTLSNYKMISNFANFQYFTVIIQHSERWLCWSKLIIYIVSIDAICLFYC